MHIYRKAVTLSYAEKAM